MGTGEALVSEFEVLKFRTLFIFGTGLRPIMMWSRRSCAWRGAA